jgi:uracil-DNA glycosylase family 4
MVVAPGTGWPGDPATPNTPVAYDASDVRQLATSAPTMREVDARISRCRACPRLVQWREEIAATKRRAFALEPYWGRPVPGFGADRPRILVVGLAPAAHGANRTGRNFTGDRSGDFLYAALYRAGLANQPTSVHAGDGLRLYHTRVVAAVRCAPPANLPTPAERDTCRPWLERQLQLAWPDLRAIVVLGGFGWSALWPALRVNGVGVPARVPAFGHGVEVRLGGVTGDGVTGDGVTGGGVTVIGCYHVSQQNTFTGRLTEPMIDAIFARARQL